MRDAVPSDDAAVRDAAEWGRSRANPAGLPAHVLSEPSSYELTMRLAFRAKPLDLYLVAAFAIAVLPLAAVNAWPLRIPLGFLLVLFLPGYSIAAAVFPKASDIDWIERIALSFGLSVATVPLLGLLLNASPWGIQMPSVIAGLLVFTLVMCALAYWIRMQLPIGERVGLAIQPRLPAWREFTIPDKALALVLGASIAIGAFAIVALPNRQADRFTEFYVLDANRGVHDYPTNLNASENATVILGVVNHEGRAMNYTLETRRVTLEIVSNVTTGKNDTIERQNVTLGSLPVNLADDNRWEAPYVFSIPTAGEYRVRFQLFAGSLGTIPYRSLVLRIHVV